MNRGIEAQIAQITELYEADQKSGHKATTKNDVPISYEAITAEWLADVLCSETPGAKIVDFGLGQEDNGSSNRRRIYITYNAAGADAGLPTTIFCKSGFDLLNRVMLGVSNCAQTEINFYKNVRPKLDIEAPEAVFAACHPQSFASIVALKDLGPKVQFGNHHTKMTFERGASQMRTLAKVHSQFYQDKALLDGSLGIMPWKEMWQNQVDNQMEYYCNLGFLAAEEVIPPRLFAQHEKIWPVTQRAVDFQATLPQTLIHCDVHLKNWYLIGESGMGLSDWQVSSSGHWGRDVAYTICTAFTPEERRKHEGALLELYREEMIRGGVPMPEMDTVWRYIKQQLFSALAFWTITLRHAPSMPDMQPEDITLEFIRRIAVAIDDHDAFASFEQELA